MARKDWVVTNHACTRWRARARRQGLSYQSMRTLIGARLDRSISVPPRLARDLWGTPKERAMRGCPKHQRVHSVRYRYDGSCAYITRGRVVLTVLEASTEDAAVLLVHEIFHHWLPGEPGDEVNNDVA